MKAPIDSQEFFIHLFLEGGYGVIGSSMRITTAVTQLLFIVMLMLAMRLAVCDDAALPINI